MAQPTLVYAFGYLLALVPPALLIGGIIAGMPYLLFALLFGMAPLTRAFLGNIPEEPGDWPEWLTTFLDRLPSCLAVVHFSAISVSILLIVQYPPISVGSWIGLGLSIWSSMLCAIPVAHELTHRRGFDKSLGSALAGLAGYPELEGEHVRHHSVSGIVEQPEWPRLHESVWSYVGRRIPHAMRSAWNHHLALRNSPSGSRFPLSIAVMLTTSGLFAVAAGAAGVATYLCVALGIHFAVQAINYIQHWGLGMDNVPNAEEGRYGWECRCQLQGWMMLNIALHHSHHQNSGTPYYRLTPHRNSARLPGSYIPLLFVSMVPSLWRKLMTPVVETWKINPALQLEPSGYRIICLPVHYSDSGERRA